MKKLLTILFLTALTAVAQISVTKTSGTNVINNGPVVIGSGNSLTASGNGSIVATSLTFARDIRSYGAACDGTTDDTAAVNAALAAAYAANGGTVVFPIGATLITGNITIPNNNTAYAGYVPIMSRQPYIRLTGYGNSRNGQRAPPSVASPYLFGNSMIVFKGACPIPPVSVTAPADPGLGIGWRIYSYGTGELEIDHLTLYAGDATSAGFIHSTGTTVYAHDLMLSGNTGLSGNYCIQDGISLGGNLGATPLHNNLNGLNDANCSFQGYGCRLDDVTFDHLRRCVYLGTFQAQTFITHCTFDSSCGDAGTTFGHNGITAPLIIDGEDLEQNGAGVNPQGVPLHLSACFTPNIISNRFEMCSYNYCISGNWMVNGTVDGNDAEDSFMTDGTNKGFIYLDANSTQNNIHITQMPAANGTSGLVDTLHYLDLNGNNTIIDTTRKQATSKFQPYGIFGCGNIYSDTQENLIPYAGTQATTVIRNFGAAKAYGTRVFMDSSLSAGTSYGDQLSFAQDGATQWVIGACNAGSGGNYTGGGVYGENLYFYNAHPNAAVGFFDPGGNFTVIGKVSAPNFSGSLTGNVTGDLNGNTIGTSGNFTGTVQANSFTGNSAALSGNFSAVGISSTATGLTLKGNATGPSATFGTGAGANVTFQNAQTPDTVDCPVIIKGHSLTMGANATSTGTHLHLVGGLAQGGSDYDLISTGNGNGLGGNHLALYNVTLAPSVARWYVDTNGRFNLPTNFNEGNTIADGGLVVTGGIGVGKSIICNTTGWFGGNRSVLVSTAVKLGVISGNNCLNYQSQTSTLDRGELAVGSTDLQAWKPFALEGVPLILNGRAPAATANVYVKGLTSETAMAYFSGNSTTGSANITAGNVTINGGSSVTLAGGSLTLAGLVLVPDTTSTVGHSASVIIGTTPTRLLFP